MPADRAPLRGRICERLTPRTWPPASGRSCFGLLLGVVAAVGCTARRPQMSLGPLASDLDGFLASHRPAPEQAIRVDEVARTAGASYHVVQACGSERPHRHAGHDLTAVVLRGRGILVHDGVRTAMAPGDVALVARGTPHWFAPDGNGCAVAVVVFTPPLDGPDSVPIDSPEGRR